MNTGRTGSGTSEDGFFYDVLAPADGRAASRSGSARWSGSSRCSRSRRSSSELARKLPGVPRRLEWFIENRPDLTARRRVHADARRGGPALLLASSRPIGSGSVLRVMLDETEFLSPYGIRSLSARHHDRPVRRCTWTGWRTASTYEPAESSHRALRRQLELARTDLVPGELPAHRVAPEVPPLPRRRLHAWSARRGSGNDGHALRRSRTSSRAGCRGIFLRDAHGRRPVFGGTRLLQDDPHFRDHLLFHEYFHGDNGAGVGASHQTGWTGLVAALIGDVP